jgi:hypothetical protein
MLHYTLVVNLVAEHINLQVVYTVLVQQLLML